MKHVGRTDGLRWGEGNILERPMPDGRTRYQARWWDGQRQRAKTFASRDAAEDWLRSVSRERRDGRYTAPSELTVRQLMTDWLARGAGNWSSSTTATYRQRTERHVLPALGSLRVTALTTPRMQHWVDGLRTRGFRPNTIDGAIRVISGALNEAVQLGIIDHNPVRGIKRPAIKQQPPATWTAEEVRRVMAQLTDEPMWRALYRVALATGMRPGELRALRWQDVEWEQGRIIVRRTITKDTDGRVIMGTRTKTDTVRAVALPGPCARALRVWQTDQKRRRLAAVTWQDDDIVFDRGDGQFLPLTSWQHKHDALIAAAGVRRITLHQCCRHTNATLDLEAGVHPKVVSDRLGHKRIETTLNLYSHVSADLHRAAAEALATRLFDDDEADVDATTS